MTKDDLAGFMLNIDKAEQYFLHCIEAEKKMGPLSREERITILKTLGSPLTLEELMTELEGKRVLVIKDNNEKS